MNGVDDMAIDETVAHASRVYDYLLGGSDNFQADRDAAAGMAEVLPDGVGMDGIESNCKQNRRFLGQAVRYLTAEHGVRQFLDIGPGIPTVNQTHQVAQRIAPESRIVYVDKDPIVVAHAHELLQGTRQGRVEFIRNDLRKPGDILLEASSTLDFTRPIALMLVAIYHMLPDSDDPHRINRRLLDELPSGSFLVASHLTSDFLGGMWDDAIERLSKATRETFVNRTRDDFARFFDGLELIPPGITSIDEWLRDGPAPPRDDVEPKLPDDLPNGWSNPLWAAIGRKV